MTTFWAQCCTSVPADIKAEEEVVTELPLRGSPSEPKNRDLNIWKGAKLHAAKKRSKSADSRFRAQ